jgi:hypothetical protein
MADNANGKGGKAPRTLFSLGRSKRPRAREEGSSPLDNYPPMEPGSTTAVAVDDGEAATCLSCGSELVPEAVFCGECGERVPEAEATAEPDEGDDDPRAEVAEDANGYVPTHADDEAEVAAAAAAATAVETDEAADDPETEAATQTDDPEADETEAATETDDPEADETEAATETDDPEAEAEAETEAATETDDPEAAVADVGDLQADDLVDADELSEGGETVVAPVAVDGAAAEPEPDRDDASGRGAFAAFAGVAGAATVAGAAGAADTADEAIDHDGSAEGESDADGEADVDEDADVDEVDGDATSEMDAVDADEDEDVDSAAYGEAEGADEVGADDDRKGAVAAAAAVPAMAYGAQTAGAAGSGGSGPGKRTALILVGTAAAIIALILGVLVLGGGKSNKVNTAGPEPTTSLSTTTSLNDSSTSTTAKGTTSTTAKRRTTKARGTTTTTARPTTTTTTKGTTTTQAQTTTTQPQTTTTLSPAHVYMKGGSCLSNGHGSGSGQLQIANSGGQSGSYYVYAPSAQPRVTLNGVSAVSGLHGTVNGGQVVTIYVNGHGFDGKIVLTVVVGAGNTTCSMRL